MAKKGVRVRIPACEIEFVEGGNTLWVHSPTGGTAFRVKVTGKITSTRCETPIGPSHSDAVVQGDLHFCLGTEASAGR